MIEVEGPVLADEAEVVRGERGEAVDEVLVLPVIVLEELDGRLGPFDHPVDRERLGALEEAVPLFGAEVLVDAAGHGARAVDLLAGRGQDDLLAELAQEDGPGGQVLVEGDDADDVPDGRVGVHAQEEVGRGEVEEVQGVGLEHLPVVHQAPHLLRRRGELARPGADDDVHGLGRGQVVADRADAAEPLDEDRGLPVGPALDEALEAAELDDVEAGLGHLAGVVQPDGDLAVAFDPGDGFDRDLSTHGRSLSVEFDQVVGQVDGPALDERGHRLPDEVGRGGASRQEGVDLDDLVARIDLVQDDRQVLVVGDDVRPRARSWAR